MQAYEVDALAENTVMVYSNYVITANMVNLSLRDFDHLNTAIQQTLR